MGSIGRGPAFRPTRLTCLPRPSRRTGYEFTLMPRLRSTSLFLASTAVMFAAGPVRGDDEAMRLFEGRIRPLLLAQCVKCHGPEKQKGGLRVDSLAGLLAGGDTGPAIEPGKPGESLLLAAIRQADEAPKMPPSGKLAAPQVEDVARWIAAGAPWPGDDGKAAAPVRKGEFRIKDSDRAHWAFQPIRRVEPPPVRDRTWSGNPVDRFVAAGLEARGLTPNPPASREELIRRATYDLTGLPPSPEEVAAFMVDRRPDAYERLIDRLLASPHYGEKWGRHWLDLVRFAETNSYERDGAKPSAWRYRDYVIRSLNADLPYDRFVREQLAGDELPEPTNDSRIATGYYRLGIWDDEPSDREQAEYDALDDIVATTGQVFLGMTIDCARCHDHKIDPIPQKDYYRLLAFFRNLTPYRNGGPTDEVPFVEPGEEALIAARGKELEAKRDSIRAEIAAIENEFRRRAGDSERLEIEELRFRFYRDSWTHLPDFDALKHENSGDLPRGLFDLAPRTRDTAFGFVFEGMLVVPRDGRYTFFLDSDDGSRLSVGGKAIVDRDGDHAVGEERTGSVDLHQGRTPIRLEYFQGVGGLGLKVAWSGPGFERRSLSADAAPTASPRPPVDFGRLLREKGPQILGAERFERYRTLRRTLSQAAREAIAGGTILTVTERGTQAPETFVLVRGNAHVTGDKVEPGYLEVLGAPAPSISPVGSEEKTSGRRRVLADWVTSPTNPLTARVMANRVFQHHFGRGIVRSPNNFGLQGDKPTHPELLDYLASDLVAGGWRLKSLHRLIMTSQAYRMSSRSDARALAKDPTNDALWRFDMRRLSAEEIRDSILSVTGTLSPRMYGPGIYPEIPKEVMAGQSVPGAGWGKSPPDEQARRSVYVHVKRSLLLPILEGFDLAETDRSTPVRFSTTQPTQALAMLNGEFLNRQAVNLSDRLEREAGADTAAQVRLALRLVCGREPTEVQIRRGTLLVDRLSTDAGPRKAREAFCLVVLNLNEFVYLD